MLQEVRRVGQKELLPGKKSATAPQSCEAPPEKRKGYKPSSLEKVKAYVPAHVWNEWKKTSDKDEKRIAKNKQDHSDPIEKVSQLVLKSGDRDALRAFLLKIHLPTFQSDGNEKQESLEFLLKHGDEEVLSSVLASFEKEMALNSGSERESFVKSLETFLGHCNNNQPKILEKSQTLLMSLFENVHSKACKLAIKFATENTFLKMLDFLKGILIPEHTLSHTFYAVKNCLEIAIEKLPKNAGL